MALDHHAAALRRLAAGQVPSTKLRATPRPAAVHPAPRSSARPMGAWEVAAAHGPSLVPRPSPKTSRDRALSSQQSRPVDSALDKHPALPSRRGSSMHGAAVFSASLMPFGVRSAAGPPMKTIGASRRPKAGGDGRRKTPKPHCGQEQNCEGPKPQERGRQRQAAAKPWKPAAGSGTSLELDHSAMHDLTSGRRRQWIK